MKPEIFTLETGIPVEIMLADHICEDDNPLEYRLTRSLPNGLEFQSKTGVITGKIILPADPMEQEKILNVPYQLSWQVHTKDGWDEDEYLIEYLILLPEE